MGAFTTEEGSIREAFRILWDRAGRYRKIARLVLPDSLWRFRRRLSGLLVVSAMSLSVQAGALGALIFYARRLEARADIELGGLTLDPTSPVVLLAAIVIGGLMFVLASFLRLFVDRGFYDIGWRYAVYCSERVLTLGSAALHRSGSKGVRLDELQLREMATGRPVLCSRVLNRLMSLLPHSASLVVFSGFLLYLDPMLAMLALLIVMVSAFFFYRLSVQASRIIPIREEKARAMSADCRRLIESIKTSGRPLTPDHFLLRRLVRHGSFAAFYAQRFRPRLLAAVSTHVGTITMAVVLTVVGLVKGSEILATGTGFGDLIVFLIAGRLAMVSITGIMTTMVRMHLYYPRVAEYFRMIEQLRDAIGPQEPNKGAGPGQPLTLAAKPLAERGSQRGPVIKPGERLALVTPKPLDRFALMEIGAGLRVKDGSAKGGARELTPSECWLVPEAPSPVPPVSFADVAGLPDEMDAVALRHALEALEIAPDVQAAVPNDLVAPMDEVACESLEPRAVWAAGLVAARHSGGPLVAIGANALDAFGETAVGAAFGGPLADRVILVAYRPGEAKRAGEFGERYVLLYDGESLLGFLPVEAVAARLDFIKGMERARKDKDAGIFIDDDMDEI